MQISELASDSSAASRIVADIAHLCSRNGASWSETLSYEIAGGSIRLLAPRSFSGALICLPTSLLIPLNNVVWGPSTSRLEITTAGHQLSSVQLDLLHLHVEFYNESKKLEWWSTSHPNTLMFRYEETREILAKLKPSFFKNLKNGNASERFLSTRVCNYKPIGKGQGMGKILMPIIDFLNHHHLGSPLEFSASKLLVKASQSADTDECFISYGNRRDVLDLAIQHGFFDQSTPFAHSCPMEIEQEGIGRIVIEGQLQSQPIHDLDLPNVKVESEGIRLSHVCFDLTNRSRTYDLLMLTFSAVLIRRGMTNQNARQHAEHAIYAIGQHNVFLLQKLAEVTDNLKHPGASILSASARRQAEIIELSTMSLCEK